MSASNVVPAHVSYLAIYSPALGPTDETIRDQLVFYYSHKVEAELEKRNKDSHARSREEGSAPHQAVPTATETRHAGEAEENERLRQIGLAQGMVDFVK